MPNTVIVIGLGCAGSAVVATLAKRGAKVIGIEQHRIGHEKGSSAHQSRAFRMAYAEHEEYVPLLKRARELWLELNDISEKKVFFETGGLYLSNKSEGIVQDSVRAAEKYDVPHYLLDSDAIHKSYPVFSLPEETIALFEPLAGMIVPERAIESYINIALEHGADLRQNVKVVDWKETESGIEVKTSEGIVTGDKLVLCKGAWTKEIEIRPSRQILTWWTPVYETAGLPVWSLQLEDDSWLYGFPEEDGLLGPKGLKVARHFPNETIDPDDENAKTVRKGDAEDVRPHLKKWLPGATGNCVVVRTCMYANSVDGHFRIGRLPNHERVTVIAGLSGHGFKFQPILGEIGADLALTGETPHGISFLAV
jgi:sarcosine oxidase